MQYAYVLEICEVNSAKETNERLADGWTLLNMFMGAQSNNQSSMTYVLGKVESESSRKKRLLKEHQAQSD